MIDVNRRGRALPRPRVQDDGLLLRPLFGRPLLVPWTRIKGVRIAPVGRWSGRNAAPGVHGHYMVQVKLAGEWRRVGQVRRVWHSVLPPAARESLLGEGRSRPHSETVLLGGYELIRARWEQGGGKPGDEDDNWPPPRRRVRPAD